MARSTRNHNHDISRLYNEYHYLQRSSKDTMSKKLINAAVDVVDEALAGLVAACPGLRLLQGHRVIVRADVDQVVGDGKVLCIAV